MLSGKKANYTYVLKYGTSFAYFIDNINDNPCMRHSV